VTPVLIGIAGGTGSGKTTIAKALVKEYGQGEVVILEQDAYYRDLSDLVPEQRKQVNFDHPDSIDIDLFIQHLYTLLKGKSIQKPVYDFSTHTRSPQTWEIHPHSVVIVEGILVLHWPAIRELLDIKIYVETPADIRFIRRLKRDIDDRGRTTHSVITQYLDTVRHMHEQFVEPSKFYADIIIPEGGQNTVAINLLRTKIDYTLSGN